jgi:hypothetical protein
MLGVAAGDGEVDPAPATGDDGVLSRQHVLPEYFRHERSTRVSYATIRSRNATYPRHQGAESGRALIIRYRDNRDAKTPYPHRVRGWLLVAHPSYKLDQ